MTSEGSEMRARTTTPASMILSEGRRSSFSNKEPQEEVLIRDLRQPDLTANLLAERTFMTDCLPVDVLQAVVQPPAPTKDLGPENSARMGMKDMLPELEQFPPPMLAERKRDVSFLSEIQPLPQIQDKPSKLDPSAVRFHYQEGLKPPKKEVPIPDSIIPTEFYIMKNRAVLGLEYDGNEPKSMKEREDGLIIFPSVKPNKRQEVVFLRDTMEAMLKKAQIRRDIDVTGTSQMKKMLDNVRKEQSVFDCIFNELIRQTIVDSPDRAEILKLLRRRYNQLVEKVPVEVRSLHDEVLAQRALDKKLTEELMRFKTTIGVLTGELADIRQHDERVSKQAKTAEDDLNMALSDSKRNAELLDEYHALYELQRARLEAAVTQNSEEKEAWSGTAYCLALKVSEEGRLNTAKRLHVASKAWTQLASHFSLMLSDLDTEMLTEMHALVGKWRDTMETVSSDLIVREKSSREAYSVLRAKMDGFRTVYQQKYVVDGQLVATPDLDKRPTILQCVLEWQEILMQEMQHFRTEDVHGIFDRLVASEGHADSWTTHASGMFKRHNLAEGHPLWELLKEMNERVSHLSAAVRARLGGDGGGAELAGKVLGSVAEWLVRCSPLLEAGDAVDEEEWLVLDDVVMGGLDDLDRLLDAMEEGQAAVNPEVLQKAHTWMSDLAARVDAMDVEMMDEVGRLHRAMVDWMVKTLLLLAPPRRDAQPESTPESATDEESVRKEAEKLFEEVDAFSNHVTKCCWEIVAKVEMKKFEVTMEALGSDGLELERIKRESDEWILAAKLLLREMYGGEIQLMKKTEEEPALSETVSETRTKGPDAVDVSIPAAGQDDVTQESKEDEDLGRSSEMISWETEQGQEGDEGEDKEGERKDKEDEEGEGGEGDEDPQTQYEAMAAMTALRIQFREAVDRTRQATDTSEEAHNELEKSQETLRNLEAAVEAATARLAELQARPLPEEKRPSLLRDSSSPRPRAALQTDATAALRQQAKLSAESTPPAPNLAPPPSRSSSSTRGTSSSVKKTDKKAGGRHRKK